MTTLNAHIVDQPANDSQAVVNLHIDNMPAGGGTPAASSITTAMLKDGSVTADKVASEAVGEGNLKANAVTTAKIKDGQVTKNKLAGDVLPKNATTAAPGIVKQAAKVENCASGDGAACQTSINAIIQSLKDAGIMASA